VADDLLKNEGKKFLEMMEKLAERRGIIANSSNQSQRRDQTGDKQVIIIFLQIFYLLQKDFDN